MSSRRSGPLSPVSCPASSRGSRPCTGEYGSVTALPRVWSITRASTAAGSAPCMPVAARTSRARISLSAMRPGSSGTAGRV